MGIVVVAESESEIPIGRIDLQTVSTVVVGQRIREEEHAAPDCVGPASVLKRLNRVPDGHFHDGISDFLLNAYAGFFMVRNERGEEGAGGEPGELGRGGRRADCRLQNE